MTESTATLATEPPATRAGWAAFADGAWQREPVVLDSPSPVELHRAYDASVAASRPFRAGTRFWTQPDVRFFVTRGQLRAPGDLLPEPADGDLPGFTDRLERRLAGEGYLLTVTAPHLMDFELWARLRDRLAELWRHVGRPTAQVTSAVRVGDRYTDLEGWTRPAAYAVLTWVLQGALRVRLWNENAGPPPQDTPFAEDEPSPGDRELSASAGQLVYWPGGYRYAERYTDRCVVLRAGLPADPRLAAAAVKEVLHDILGSSRETDGTVPYEPYQPGRAPGPLAATSDALRRTLDGPELSRVLRIRWAARCSAAGLEPVPAPRPGDTLTPRHRIRSAAEVFRIRDTPGRSVWAVNGHVFQVAGTVADQVLERLGTNAASTGQMGAGQMSAGSTTAGSTTAGSTTAGSAVRSGPGVGVDELCRAVGGEAGGAAVLALLRKLYSLRGVEVVGED